MCVPSYKLGFVCISEERGTGKARVAETGCRERLPNGIFRVKVVNQIARISWV